MSRRRDTSVCGECHKILEYDLPHYPHDPGCRNYAMPNQLYDCTCEQQPVHSVCCHECREQDIDIEFEWVENRDPGEFTSYDHRHP